MHWFGRRVRRPASDDVVVLDGPFAQLPWPVEEAEALLADVSDERGGVLAMRGSSPSELGLELGEHAPRIKSELS